MDRDAIHLGVVLRGINFGGVRPVRVGRNDGHRGVAQPPPDVLGKASAVDLPAGAELRGIDFTLIRDRKVHIRGKIVDASSGKPPEMAQVSMSLRDSAGSAVDLLGALGGALQGNTYNPTTGEFEIKEVSTVMNSIRPG